MRKIALVTGGSKGIGKAIAIRLAKLDYSTVITGRNIGSLQKTTEEVKQFGGDCLPIVADFMDDASPSKVISEVIQYYGGLDVLVNNAGMVTSGLLTEITSDVWDGVFKVNAKAPFFLCKEAIPFLIKSEKPIIINISSVVGFKGYENQSVYASSKHALTGFTKVLAKEVQPMGIQVHLISPGGVATDMVTKVRPDINAEELIQSEEIADIVEFIVKQKGKGTIDHFYIRRNSSLPFDY